MRSVSRVARILLLTIAVSAISATAQAPSAPQPPAPPAVSTPEVSIPRAATPGVEPSAPGRPPAGAFGRAPGPKSPEMAADGSVTFRLLAPQATAVAVRGSWQKQREAPLAMAKDEKGVWTLKVDALTPEVYTYTFIVDGVSMLDPGNVYIARDGTRYQSSLLIPGEASALYDEGDVPHGTVHQVWYASPTLRLAQRRMYIYTPAGYEDSTAKYPVLYLLHGAGGDEDAWDNMAHANQIMDHLIASGKAKPMLVVMTNGNYNQAGAPGVIVQAPGNGFSLPGNNPADPTPPDQVQPIQMFSESVVKDVIPYVEKHFRVLADRDHRAVAGLSMGGAQTMLIGLNHLDKFSYLASFSGAFVMWPNAIKRTEGRTVTGLGLGEPLDMTVVESMFPTVNTALNPKLHLLYLSIGQDDSLVTANQEFMDWLTQKGVVYQKKILPGYAHVWPFWRISLADVVPQLFASTAPAHK